MQTMVQLEKAGVPEARLDAEYLVAEAAGIPRLQLVLKSNLPLKTVWEERLSRWTRERLERRPLAYVLGEQPFMDLKLRVTPAVLIPRPETELLVEEAYRLLDARSEAVVVDVGTGSGNIALSLAKHAQVCEVHAVDISEAALIVAKENALRNRIHKPIRWHLGDLLTPLLTQPESIDMIVANLPYVRLDELSDLSPEVRWEPGLALNGGRDGLAYIAQLIDQAQRVLRPGGELLLEIGSKQGPAVLKLLRMGRWTDPHVKKDLAGHPRMVIAQKGI